MHTLFSLYGLALQRSVGFETGFASYGLCSYFWAFIFMQSASQSNAPASRKSHSQIVVATGSNPSTPLWAHILWVRDSVAISPGRLQL